MFILYIICSSRTKLLIRVNKLTLNLDSVCYVIFKIIDNVNDEPIWQQTHYCYWYDQSRGGLCANEDACTFTLAELAKTMYKCYKTVQSPREFKETFPARSKKHFPDAFVLKNAWTYDIHYPAYSTAFKLSWWIFQLVVFSSSTTIHLRTARGIYISNYITGY